MFSIGSSPFVFPFLSGIMVFVYGLFFVLGICLLVILIKLALRATEALELYILEKRANGNVRRL